MSREQLESPDEGSSYRSALEHLHHWLVRPEPAISPKGATLLADSIRDFHSFAAYQLGFPALPQPILAVTATRHPQDGTIDIHLSLLWPDHVTTASARSHHEKLMRSEFVRRVGLHSPPNVSVDLNFVDEIPDEHVGAHYLGLQGLTREDEDDAQKMIGVLHGQAGELRRTLRRPAGE